MAKELELFSRIKKRKKSIIVLDVLKFVVGQVMIKELTKGKLTTN